MDAHRKVRLNADLSPAVAAALKKLAATQGVSLTEASSRAISTESTLAEKRRKDGKVLEQEGDDLKEMIFTRKTAPRVQRSREAVIWRTIGNKKNSS